jgi:hypothetical protein
VTKVELIEKLKDQLAFYKNKYREYYAAGDKEQAAIWCARMDVVVDILWDGVLLLDNKEVR